MRFSPAPKPSARTQTTQRLGFWKVQRTSPLVDAAAAWDAAGGGPRALKESHFTFAGAR